MKVLLVIDGLGTGGAERSLAEMLPRMVDAGIRPTIAVLFRRDEGVQDDVLEQGYEVRFLRGTNLASRVRELRAVLRRERPDLVHTTLFKASLVGRLACVGGSAPVLTSLVSTPYARARLLDPRVGRLSLRLVRVIDGWSARHLTEHFHAITGAVKRAAVSTLRIAPDRVTVIERGRDGARLGEPGPERSRRARRRLGLSDRDQVVVNVGRHEFPKGHRFLLEATEALARKRPRLVVLMAGRDGHATAELDRLREGPGVRRAVRFLGHRDDVPDLLAAGDLFVFPSLFEGLGGALIEAMALGLPIVASDVEAIREVVEDGRNALLVPPGSADALAAGIESILDDAGRSAAFGERSRAIFEERFTVERSAGRMIELYRSLAGARDPGRPVTVPT